MDTREIGSGRSLSDGIVTLTTREAIREINKSYQTANRVKSYVASQNYVVSKAEFFEAALEVLKANFSGRTKPLRVFEPGMGPAAFSRNLLQSSVLSTVGPVHVEGTDISDEMLLFATNLINNLYRENAVGEAIAFNLTAGVNGMDLSDPYYRKLERDKQRFDVIITSQFEHYFPNSESSPLAEKLKAKGISYSTKRAFRKYCYGLLAQGGIVFTVDDRLGETAEEHAEICRAWDTHVVNQFTDPDIIKRLESLNRSLASNLRMTYDASRPKEELVKIAAKTREHRRDICYEEIEPISRTKKDFIEIYGEENVQIMMHPSGSTHPGFYLIWATKK